MIVNGDTMCIVNLSKIAEIYLCPAMLFMAHYQHFIVYGILEDGLRHLSMMWL